MSENYIVINGKKAELTEEQLKALGIEVEKPDPFARVRYGETFYYITSDGDRSVGITDEVEGYYCDCLHEVANYCIDYELIYRQALREELNRLLWRFTHQNGWSDELWENDDPKYVLKQDRGNSANIGFCMTTKQLGVVCFVSDEIANRAINEIVKPFMEEHPDFMW